MAAAGSGTDCATKGCQVKHVVRWLLGLVAGAAVAALVLDLRKKQAVATSTVNDIEAQIAALDPVTRAAVVGRLSKDSAQAIHNRG